MCRPAYKKKKKSAADTTHTSWHCYSFLLPSSLYNSLVCTHTHAHEQRATPGLSWLPLPEYYGSFRPLRLPAYAAKVPRVCIKNCSASPCCIRNYCYHSSQWSCHRPYTCPGWQALPADEGRKNSPHIFLCVPFKKRCWMKVRWRVGEVLTQVTTPVKNTKWHFQANNYFERQVFPLWACTVMWMWRKHCALSEPSRAPNCPGQNLAVVGGRKEHLGAQLHFVCQQPARLPTRHVLRCFNLWTSLRLGFCAWVLKAVSTAQVPDFTEENICELWGWWVGRVGEHLQVFYRARGWVKWGGRDYYFF